MVSHSSFNSSRNVCVVDLFFQQKEHQKGFIAQEDFILNDFLNNQFGKIYL